MNGSGALAYERYRTGFSDEWMMRIGRAAGPPILFLPPLFEEMNRTRALIAGIMRALAASGYGCWLPDLPGTGESERPLGECGWQDWRAAAKDAGEHVRQAAASAPLVAALRGGCLLDDMVGAQGYWRFAPVPGASLARDLTRAALVASTGGEGSGRGAGYPLPQALFAPLAEAVPAAASPVRTVRLESDPGAADRKVAGPALWRRSEPESSSELVGTVASEIDQWYRICAAS